MLNHDTRGMLKGTCEACPFNCTDEADYLVNIGCLPCGYEIIKMKQQGNGNWACHEDPSKICVGLCHVAKENELDLTVGRLVPITEW